MCCFYPNFLYSIKIKHVIYFTCIEGIIFSINVVYDLRGSGPNTYSMCEGRLLLHPQYDVVQIGFITQFPAMGIPFSIFVSQPAMHRFSKNYRTPLHLGRPSTVQRYSSSMHRAMEEVSLMIRHDDDEQKLCLRCVVGGSDSSIRQIGVVNDSAERGVR